MLNYETQRIHHDSYLEITVPLVWIAFNKFNKFVKLTNLLNWVITLDFSSS